jgi:hypothetical protein
MLTLKNRSVWLMRPRLAEWMKARGIARTDIFFFDVGKSVGESFNKESIDYMNGLRLSNFGPSQIGRLA